MMTHDNCSPRTSTPCQKLAVAKSTACGVVRNFSSSPAFDALPWTKQGKSTSRATRSYRERIPLRDVESTKARPCETLSKSMTSSAALSLHCGERGSGMRGGR